MQFKNDVQSEIPANRIPINKVGITNVRRKVEIQKGPYQFSINAKINAFISLPGSQRGIHMSRTAEGIEFEINNAAVKPAENIESFCLRIIDSLMVDHQYTNHAEVEMTGDLFISLKSTERDQTQKVYEMYAKVLADRLENGEIDKNIQVGISAMGMTACPCAQEMSRDYAKDLISSRSDIEISENQIDKILNIIPIASHNQRARGQVIIGGGTGNEELVDVMNLVDIIENSMSGHIKSVLKRPEEAELVRIAHLNPMFVEDVVRGIAEKLNGEKFSDIADNCTLQIIVDAYESIHYHNAHAEHSTTFGEIRKYYK